MNVYYKNIDKKISDERTRFTKKCSCGHSVIVYPTMKRDFTYCTWCGKKVFKNIEDQKVYDEKIKREEFRMNMWDMICSN